MPVNGGYSIIKSRKEVKAGVLIGSEKLKGEIDMIYLVKRSLYYYFLMREVTDAESEAWCFIAKVFGVKPKDMKAYQKVLENQTLNELSTIDDIDMHKNYILSLIHI